MHAIINPALRHILRLTGVTRFPTGSEGVEEKFSEKRGCLAENSSNDYDFNDTLSDKGHMVKSTRRASFESTTDRFQVWLMPKPVDLPVSGVGYLPKDAAWDG